MKKILLVLPFIVLLTACGESEIKATPKAEPIPATYDLIENSSAFKTK